jgi:hypothetical protein
VAWSHTYTAEANVLDTTCQNCHGDESNHISARDREYLRHSDVGRVSRQMMDKAEMAELGHVLGATPGTERNQLCSTCHEGGRRSRGGSNKLDDVSCNSTWRQHLTDGRVSEVVWEEVSRDRTGTTCGW